MGLKGQIPGVPERFLRFSRSLFALGVSDDFRIVKATDSYVPPDRKENTNVELFVFFEKQAQKEKTHFTFGHH